MRDSFGAEYVAPPSNIDIIKALPVELIILSVLLAVFPFVLYRLRKYSGIKELLIRFFAISLSAKAYFDRRIVEKAATEEFNRFREKGKYRNIIKIVLEIVVPVIIIVLIINKSLFFGIVTTQSMVPTIFPKELVLVEGLTKDIKKGEIIVFKKPGYQEIVIHRVFSIEDGIIKTKGDNSDVDPWSLRKSDVLGKAVTIFGKPMVGLKNIGYYFMPIRTPFAATDPSLKAMTDTISALRLYGPIIAVVLLLLAVTAPPSRKKDYYGRYG